MNRIYGKVSLLNTKRFRRKLRFFRILEYHTL